MIKETFEKTITIKIGHVLSVLTLIISTAIAAGAYKSAFDDTRTQIALLGAQMTQSNLEVRKLTEAVIRLEERLGAMEKYERSRKD